MLREQVVNLWPPLHAFEWPEWLDSRIVPNGIKSISLSQTVSGLSAFETFQPNPGPLSGYFWTLSISFTCKLTTNRSMPLPKSPGRAKPVADFRHPQSLSSVSLSHPNQFSKWSHFGFALYANFGICLELWYCWETWLCDSLRIIAECSAYARWGLCVERPQVGNRALSSERWPEWQWSVCDKTRR